jgi:hypothetical protein
VPGLGRHPPRVALAQRIARLVRDGSSAEIAFAVADEHRQRDIGSALAAELIIVDDRFTLIIASIGT